MHIDHFSNAARAVTAGPHIDPLAELDAEGEEHVRLCDSCRAEVEDLREFAGTVEEDRPSAASPLAKLLEMRDEMLAAEMDGPLALIQKAELLMRMCDEADGTVEAAVLAAIKWQALSSTVFSAPSCGEFARAESCLQQEADLLDRLPNSDHYLARLDLGRLYLRPDVTASNVPLTDTAALDRAEDIALSFGDTRLFFLIVYFQGHFYFRCGRYDLAARAFVTASHTLIPWHRQTALCAAVAAFFRLGEIDRAEEYLLLGQQEKVEPPSVTMIPRIPWQRGLIALGRGQYAEACRLLRETVELMSPVSSFDTASVYVDLADAYILAGDHSAAVEAAQLAVQVFSKAPLGAVLNHALAVLKEALASREIDSIRSSLNEVRESAGVEPWKYY
jgi:tetratricopeptide (TPR) repeat protein